MLNIQGEETLYDSKNVLKPVGGCYVYYTVSSAPQMKATTSQPPSAPPSSQPQPQKPIGDRVTEIIQNASLKFLQELIHQKQFEEFKQALDFIKIDNNLKLLQLNLRLAISKNNKTEESYDKVIKGG